MTLCLPTFVRRQGAIPMWLSGALAAYLGFMPSAAASGGAGAPVSHTPSRTPAASGTAATAPSTTPKVAPNTPSSGANPSKATAAGNPNANSPSPSPAAAAEPTNRSGAATDTDPNGVLSATKGVAVVQPQGPTETRAADLAAQAMREYRAGRNRIAEKRMRQALELCLNSGCTVPFRARLNRDIGIIYVGGMRHVEEGKDEFATALTADPTVCIPEAFNTRAIADAFLDVKRAMLAESSAPTSAVAAPLQTKEPDTRPTTSQAKPFEENAASNKVGYRAVANGFSIGIQQDFLIHSSTENVCNNGSRYVCYDGNNVPQNFTGTGVSGGNDITASGVRTASLRILVGYERLLSNHFSIGLKLGGLVRGAAPQRAGDPKLFLYHGEARLSVYPGQEPFSPTRHVRPYFFVTGGIGEIDGKISVEVRHADGQTVQYAAWKRTGKFFAGGGLGIVFPFRASHGPFIEAKFLRMTEKPSFAMGAMLGYQVGF